MLMTFLMALALRSRHILAKARSAANRLATSAHDLSGAAQALLPHVTGAAQKCWNWFIGPLVEQAPAPVATSTLAVMAPPRRVPVKDRDTLGAIAALELAMAYLTEVREADRPAFDDELTRKQHLNTLSLAAKQLEKAESLDPDAVYEREADDGTPLRFSVSEVKAEALFLEGMTHSTYDMKRAIPSLMKA